MDCTKLNPLHNRLVVRRAASKDTTAGGIIIPEVAKTKNVVAEVIAVGPGNTSTTGERIPMSVEPGDTVLLEGWKGDEVTVDGQQLVIIPEDNVLGVFEE